MAFLVRRVVIHQKFSHCSHCSPLLHGNFSEGLTSANVLTLQPIAAHSNLATLIMGGNSSKVLPLQPNAAHSYLAILVRDGNSLKILPLHTIAAHSYIASLVSGGNSSKVIPLQPNSYIILTPHYFINLPPIGKLPPLHIYNKMGGFQGGHSTRVSLLILKQVCNKFEKTHRTGGSPKN